MTLDKQTLIVVGASTILGFVGDSYTYSVAASEGKAFKFEFPKGKALRNILIAGIVGGFIIDYAIKQIERRTMSEEEKRLVDLADEERVKIRSGQRIGQIPTQVMYKLIT